MFSSIIGKLRFQLLKRQWRKANPHNGTYRISAFDPENVTVGDMTYGPLDVSDWSDNVKLVVGSFCSIAPGVVFLLGGEHPTDFISTFPFKVRCFGYPREASNKGDIVIKDDVWIGTNSIIGAGVTLGQGSVVAAGSVVTKSVPPYCIVGGVPAKPIKFRFPEIVIEKLIAINLKDLFAGLSSEKQVDLYTCLSCDNIDAIIQRLSSR